eukprot:g35423.t1
MSLAQPNLRRFEAPLVKASSNFSAFVRLTPSSADISRKRQGSSVSVRQPGRLSDILSVLLLLFWFNEERFQEVGTSVRTLRQGKL